MKKTLSLILALLMSASCASYIFADEAEEVEATSVITEEAPAEEEVVEEAETAYDLAISFLEEKKIMQGKGDGLLHAEDAVKRYEMAILGARVATGWVTNDAWMNGTADNTKFNDLEGSGAINALGALSYANQNGIVVGYPDGSFKPENTVTYRDALAIAVRTLGYTGLEYPWGIIEKAVTLNLTKGIEGVAYTDTINRGVAAQIIYNALFAKTASGKTLAMESFNCEYGWETIVVVADDKAVYELDGAPTPDAKGIVSFKLVEDDGTLSAETFNAKADLAFGCFYNALFEKNADEALVKLIASKEMVPEVITNDGNDDDDDVADDIGAYLKELTLVDKYDAKNITNIALYGDEIILKGVEDKSIITGWDTAKAGAYAIDWATGDILKAVYDKDGKLVDYVIEWHYYELLDTYFQYVNLGDVVIDEDLIDEDRIIGWDIMDDKDVEELKAAIKDTYAIYETKTGYTVIENKPEYSAYAALTAYDLDNGIYATYEEYALGYYTGIEAHADECEDCDATKCIKIGAYHKALEGSCEHYAPNGEDYDNSWTIDELTEGYTGWVIFGANEATNEFKIVKEIPAYSEELVDEDSYVATGVVRGYNPADKKVTIGNTTYSYEYKALRGADAVEKINFNEYFNQFVEYVLVDGIIAHIEVKGATTENYIVVEKYLGIDNDGYIVIQGYTTDDRVLDEFRIGAYDGWKQGSGFFYADQIELENNFIKGNVYQITSVDTTEENGDVYYVTAIGVERNGEIVAIDTDAPYVQFYFEDNYRFKVVDGKETSKKMSADDVYVIVGNYDPAYNFKPIYFYKGIVPGDGNWFVEGNLLVEKDHLFVIVNAPEFLVVNGVYVDTIGGFDAETYKTSFVATLDKVDYQKVGFDGYTSDYYYYGATSYKVKAFDLINADYIDTITGYNLDLDEESIYVTIDNVIVDDTAYGWDGFWAAMNEAYGDIDATTAEFYPFTYWFDADTAKDDISEILSQGFFGLSRNHDDLIEDLIVKVITLNEVDGVRYLADIESLSDADLDLADYEGVKAYCIYRASDAKVVVYLDPTDVDELAAVDTDDYDASNYIDLDPADAEGFMELHASANITSVVNDGFYAATLNSLTFSLEGDKAADNHNAIDVANFHFGDAGLCTIENWLAGLEIYDDAADVAPVTAQNVFGSIIATTYDELTDCEEGIANCDLVKDVTFVIDTNPAKEGNQGLVLTPDWQWIAVTFTTNEEDPDITVTYNLMVAIKIATDAEGYVTGIDFKFSTVNGYNTYVVNNGATTNCVVK